VVRNSRFAVASRYQLIGLGLLVAVLLALVALPGRSQAATEPFKIDFDQSTMQVGLLSDLPLGELASTASLEGTIDDQGNVTVPKGKFTLPEIGITDPLTVKMFMGIESDATGTFNAQTGALVLNAKAGVWVSVNLPELFDALDTLGLDVSGQLGPLAGIIGGVGDLTCGFSPMDVTFTTGETSLGSGSPFTKGPLGPGALTAEWSQLGPFSGKTKILGLIDVCQAIKQYAPSLIEGALSGSLPDGIDLGNIDLASLLNNLDNVNLGPSSLTLTRTLDENVPEVVPPASPALKLSVSPKRRKARAGKKASFTVKVKNSGKAPATGVKICVKTPGASVVGGGRCRTLGKVMAGATQTRRFRIRTGKKRKKPVKAVFTVRASNAGRSSASARLLIRH